MTINSEIASHKISKLDDTSLPLANQRHYFRRIGQYLEGNQDKWWLIDNVELAEKSANEILSIIKSKIIPNFESLRSTNDLVNLWKKGEYGGLTEGQTDKYLTLFDGTIK